MNFKFCPNPEEEDLRFHKLHYCFGGDGGSGSGGSSGSGMSPAAAGEAGASDNAGEGMGDYGGYSEPTGGRGYTTVDGVGVTNVDGQYGYGAPGTTGTTDSSISGGFGEASYAELDAISAQFDTMNNATGMMSSDAYGNITAYEDGYDLMDVELDIAAKMQSNLNDAYVSSLNFFSDPDRVAMNRFGEFKTFDVDPTRVDAEQAQFLADVLHEALPDAKNTGMMGFGNNNYVTDLSNLNNPVIAGLVDENSIADGVVNFFAGKMGLGISMDKAEFVDNQSKSYTYTQAAVLGGLLSDTQLMETNAYNAMMAEANAQPQAEDSGSDYEASVQAASPATEPLSATTTTARRPSRVRQAFMQSPYSTGIDAYSYNMNDDPFGYFSYTNPYANARFMAEGGDVEGQMAEVTGEGPNGFVGDAPENLPEAATVADDVPVDVPEGSFVINAAAVEFAGSADIQKMLVDAMQKADEQGIDISGSTNKIDKNKLANLIVSRGEVLVSPTLVKIIGLDRLEKINNRGKEETDKRIAEHGQATDQPSNPAEGTIAAAYGADLTDTTVIDIYSSIQSQGGNPGNFETFRDAMDLYKGTKTYRPMASQPGTPEFDAEVRDRYKLFFPDNPYPLMSREEIDATASQDKANMIDESLPINRIREDGTIYYIDRKTGKEVPAPKQEMAGGGFAESLARATEKYSEREPQVILHDLQMTDDRQEVSGEISGDGFAVRGRANRSQDARSTEYPDGVVVDEENKNLGFALNGELYLFDDTWLNAGIEKQKGSVKGTANIPTGDKVMFGDQFEMTRYNMGATFGDLNLDVSGMPGEGIDRGRIKYKLNKNGDELSIEGDKSGNISAGLRLSF